LILAVKAVFVWADEKIDMPATAIAEKITLFIQGFFCVAG